MGGGSLRAEIALGIDIEFRRGCKTKNNKLCNDYEGFKASDKTVTCTLWLVNTRKPAKSFKLKLEDSGFLETF